MEQKKNNVNYSVASKVKLKVHKLRISTLNFRRHAMTEITGESNESKLCVCVCVVKKHKECRKQGRVGMK